MKGFWEGAGNVVSIIMIFRCIQILLKTSVEKDECLLFVSLWNPFEVFILQVFIKRWGWLFGCRYLHCSILVCCYRCISILIIILTFRCCFLVGLLCCWMAVVLSVCTKYPSFRNFNTTISIDVIRMESYLNSFFDPTCEPVRVTINFCHQYWGINPLWKDS